MTTLRRIVSIDNVRRIHREAAIAYFKHLPRAPRYRDLPSWTDNSDHVIKRLVNAAWNALHDRDVDDISLRELAQEIGVSQPAAYNHFKNRTHLFAAVAFQGLRTLAAELGTLWPDGGTVEKGILADVCRVWLRFAEERPRHYALMFSLAFNDAAAHPNNAQQREDLRKFFSVVGQAESGVDIPLAHSDLAFALLHGVASLVASGQPKPQLKAVTKAMHVLFAAG